MIVGFRHKGLERFYRTGSTRGIQADHAAKLNRMLGLLDVSSSPAGMDVPGWRLHPLKGRLAGYWAVWVSGNWRLVFRFENGDAHDIDYLDYH